MAGGGVDSGARSALGDGGGVGFAGGPPRGSTSASIRIAVLVALLILAVYTGFAVVKLERAAQQAPDVGDAAPAAEALAGHAEGEIARLQAALTAAGAVAQRLPAQPMDAAEAAFKAARPSARAVALVGDDGVRAGRAKRLRADGAPSDVLSSEAVRTAFLGGGVL